DVAIPAFQGPVRLADVEDIEPAIEIVELVENVAATECGELAFYHVDVEFGAQDDAGRVAVHDHAVPREVQHAIRLELLDVDGATRRQHVASEFARERWRWRRGRAEMPGFQVPRRTRGEPSAAGSAQLERPPASE